MPRLSSSVEEILSNPIYNFKLKLPSSQVLVDRILSNDTLRGHYRPDHMMEAWTQRPEPDQVSSALESTLQGLHSQTLWRTAHDYGIFWNDKTKQEILHDLALVLYSQLGPFK